MLEYGKFAKYYDLLYAGLDYNKGALGVGALYSKYNKSGGKDMLDVACGTGKHISKLYSKFNCFGVDISKDMIVQARKNCSHATFKVGKMQSFKINKSFDIITLLFNSTNHLKNIYELKKTVDNVSKHLKPGGLLVVEMFHDINYFLKNSHHLRIHDGKDIKIARIGKFSLKNNNHVDVIMEYLISEKGKNIIKAHEKISLFVITKDKPCLVELI